MADRHAIDDLFTRYAWGNDIRDVDLIETLLVPEATFSLSIAGETVVGPFDDRAAMIAFYREALGGQSDQRRHVTTNLRYLEEADDRAKLDAYLTLLATEDGTPRVVCTGLYHAEVVQRDGAWLFASLVIALDSGF
jgi:hypothetical protein